MRAARCGREIFKADGHQVATASSGAEAMTKLLEEHFDLLLPDHPMGHEGLQSRGRAETDCWRPAVILMTASNEVASC